MSNGEAEFLLRLRGAFLAEARDHLQAISSELLALEKAHSPETQAQSVETVFRHTHSLKGSARAANFAEVERICQELEDLFTLCKRHGRPLSSADFDTVYEAFDLVGAFVGAPRATTAEPTPVEVEEVSARLRATTEGGALRGDPVSAAPSPDPVVPGRDPHPIATGTGPFEDPGRSGAAAATPLASMQTVRVATRKLERMMRATEQLLTLKQAGAEQVRALRVLEQGFDEWDKRLLAVQAPLRRLRGAEPKLFEFIDSTLVLLRETEGRLRSLVRTAERQAHVTGRDVDELLAESKNLLMRPFAAVSELLPRPVRDLARDQGKEVALRVSGGDVRLDKRVLEQITDPILHLVRNAIDHGIETPEQRAALGKPARATLSVEARLVHGNAVEIVVADDGRGMDPERLRKAAVRAGLVAQEAASLLDDKEALELAFRSDLSTSATITGISGRGLGLAIVREQVDKLGGTITVENRAPVGARFRIRLPQSLAVFRGVLVRVAGKVFVIPSIQLERVARTERSKVKTVENRETIRIGDELVALVGLGEVLDLERESMGRRGDFVDLVLLGAGRDRVAFAVDEVLHDEEVLAKRLERPLVRVRHIAGATVLASGKVLLILNVADLLKSVKRAGTAPARVAGETVDPALKAFTAKVLLAEDSITSRLLLKGILEAEGCEVKTAVDGLEALTALRNEPFDVLVSDVEMPRMNGFELTAKVRADETLAQLPVVLVTALASREDRERGIDVGANAYITKGGFDQRELIGAVRRLVATRTRP
jgi:two-component system chemotaxis sensor kinase CheA